MKPQKSKVKPSDVTAIGQLIAVFDNNQRNVIRALEQEGFKLHPQHLHAWKKGTSKITAEWCIALEKVSDGRVTRKMLRPDIFN